MRGKHSQDAAQAGSRPHISARAGWSGIGRAFSEYIGMHPDSGWGIPMHWDTRGEVPDALGTIGMRAIYPAVLQVEGELYQ